MVTLKDVAKAANVSIPLVSKVLNNSLGNTRARPETIEHVRKIAAELGYQRNETAAALRSGRQNAIGIYFRRQGAQANSMVEAMLDGISSVCEPLGIRQNMAFYSNDEGFRKLAKRIRPNMFDGIIIGGYTSKGLAEDLARIQTKSMPIVTIFGNQVHPDIVNVGNESKLIGKLATNHLIQQGCKTIVHIFAQPNTPFLYDRHIGYQQALEENSIAYDESLTVQTEEFDFESGHKAIDKLLSDGKSFDGVVCESDPQAMGAMRRLAESDIRVPEKVKVIGVDNSPFCTFNLVTLTSISTNPKQRGQIATEKLMNMIKGKSEKTCHVDPVLVVRESSGK